MRGDVDDSAIEELKHENQKNIGTSHQIHAR